MVNYMQKGRSFAPKYCEVVDMNEYITQDFVKNALPKRKSESNKSTFGRVLLVCGSDSMRGAAALAARGALRLGAGLVTLASTKSVIDTLSASLYEPIYLDVESGDLFKTAEKMQVIGLGCGLGAGEITAAWTAKFLSSAGAPLILDADGINALSGHAHLLRQAKRPVLLTPHPLEFSRLSGLTVKAIQADRAHITRTFAAEYGITLLLKGANTVVTDGKTTLINPTGSSALAKGGSGDALCGMICALAAQGTQLLEAAAIAAYLHGMAGQRLAKIYSEYGVLPGDLPAEAARILAEWGY